MALLAPLPPWIYFPHTHSYLLLPSFLPSLPFSLVIFLLSLLPHTPALHSFLYSSSFYSYFVYIHAPPPLLFFLILPLSLTTLQPSYSALHLSPFSPFLCSPTGFSYFCSSFCFSCSFSFHFFCLLFINFYFFPSFFYFNLTKHSMEFSTIATLNL